MRRWPRRWLRRLMLNLPQPKRTDNSGRLRFDHRSFMAQLQHRGGLFGKIVLKHHPLNSLAKHLETVETLAEVQTIIPGVMSSVRGRPIGPRQQGGLSIRVQYIAPDGRIRLIARSANSTQEVRVVSSDPAKTFAQLSEKFPQ